MKTGKIFLLLTFLIIMMSFMAQSATAGCAGIFGLDPILTNPNAPGTKLSGPLTIYHKDGILYYFVRLKQGANIYFFSGSSPIPGNPPGTPGNWIIEAQGIIDDWFEDTVIPYVACDTPLGVDQQCSNTLADLQVTWDLKSYSLDVLSGTDLGFSDSMDASIMDVVVAFQ